jgi:alcohol dehydrogenase (cytochrome c)
MCSRTDDGRVHLLRRAGARVRGVTSGTSWPTYNGDPGGNRYTTLTEINKDTIGRLAPSWIFTVPGTNALQVTPVVVGGIMYVSAPNECYALDAGSGRLVWRYQQPRTQQLAWTNRGVGVAGDRVFMLTDHAHIIALNRFTGALLWDSELEDWRKNYFSTAAPLPAGSVVISGVSGGEHGANGFVAAHDQVTGKEVWRFWTVPKPGTPGSETWQGKDIDHGGAPTWFTGSYDPVLDVVYWPVGNPSKEYNGDDRLGDNLSRQDRLPSTARPARSSGTLPVHAASLGLGRDPDLGLDRHGVAGPDAPSDAPREPQRVLLRFRSHRRKTAAVETVRAQPHVGEGHRRRWPADQAAESGTDGGRNEGLSLAGRRDQLVLTLVQSADGSLLRPDVREVQHLHEERRRRVGAGEVVSRRIAARRAGSAPQRILKAIDIRTGAIKWELPQVGPGDTWGGTLATASGLVIFGDDSGALRAADAVTGRPLWSFPVNQSWHASPMTYQFDGKQYIAIAAGGNILTFAIR